MTKRIEDAAVKKGTNKMRETRGASTFDGLKCSGASVVVDLYRGREKITDAVGSIGFDWTCDELFFGVKTGDKKRFIAGGITGGVAESGFLSLLSSAGEGDDRLAFYPAGDDEQQCMTNLGCSLFKKVPDEYEGLVYAVNRNQAETLRAIILERLPGNVVWQARAGVTVAFHFS